MVLWNEFSRDIRKGIHIGKDPKCPVIVIPSDFDTLEHYAVSCMINKVEVHKKYINKVEVHKNIHKQSRGTQKYT